ncbi:MAG: NTP transferase domain-containing protein [Chthoniobacteraceae bacterium]
MPPTLLVLAAGMGSRYGGLKQLDPMGPSGETLLDYSVFDALQAGFGRVVFVIRHAFEADFRERVGRRYEGRTDVAYVFQEMDALPAGFSVGERQKPWGTGHAIWCAREQVRAPFATINADDFYGAAAYEALGRFFEQPAADAPGLEFAMVGYRLGRTLSDHGSVSRGICQVDTNGFLTGVRECVGLTKDGADARLRRPDGSDEKFLGDETVSMNFWGFTPEIFPLLEVRLEQFLHERSNDPKAEFYIPEAVADMVKAKAARVRVLKSDGDWFGVTFPEDKPVVVAALECLVAAGQYPRNLWSPVD